MQMLHKHVEAYRKYHKVIFLSDEGNIKVFLAIVQGSDRCHSTVILVVFSFLYQM